VRRKEIPNVVMEEKNVNPITPGIIMLLIKNH
jgi:hypothetical protein